jgi:serine/threonine protein kinase/formylglycine-generating enzyme required for sulfatase activity
LNDFFSRRSPDPQLPLSQQKDVDGLCDEFERRWQAGEKPRIEDFLERLPLTVRHFGLAELLTAELRLLEAVNQRPDLDDYRRRFSGYLDVVELVLRTPGDRSDHDRSPASKNPTATGNSITTSGSQPPLAPDEPPLVRIGRYDIVRLLGGGGFGCVYLAHDSQLQRHVALKVPNARWFARGTCVESFLAEARHAARLKHPGLVTVYDVQQEGERPYIVQEFIDGLNLGQWVERKCPDINEVARLLSEIGEAVGYAHQQGLVHRDLKPANILIDARGHTHVADFGLALDESARWARSGETAGTLPYMSPEQVRGETNRLDGRTDIWSLGVMLYELLVGSRPFTAQDRNELCAAIKTLEPLPLRQRDPRVPKELERICLKCLERRRNDRYTAAADLVDDLRHWLAHGDPVAEPSSLAIAKSPGAADPPPASKAAAIVPKGLRSFDEHDKDFFLRLLPGPRDRDGLPEGIRLWKIPIDETDADQTFAVGLLYGPSGCGKSSLVKAGLLPRLGQHVLPVYVEAMPDDTEVRLLKRLRKQAPRMPPEANLPESVEWLRENLHPRDRKIVIVLDQFEQWLHAHGDYEASQLVDALRHCDGGRVQCLVLVRDDFWMAATRFMRALEIRLVEGQNSSAVDLFSVRHAEDVLRKFGRAFRALSEASPQPFPDESDFIQQAVAGLSENGKVICVRLALFAEMMKGRPWTRAALKEVGGAKGVGATFLEETFSAATAPPEHRYHQKGARAVLKALLPDTGADIKGSMRSHDELLRASGYAGRPGEFAELVRILDHELRLITPTDPEAHDRVEVENVPPGARYYQLSHDYLVHSLRDWLASKQRETRRGRAELCLAERAVAWNARPDARLLPSFWESPAILLWTRQASWTPAERRVMRAAARHHGSRFALLALIGLALGWIGADRYRREQAWALVQQLKVATAPRVVEILKELVPYERYAEQPLEELTAQTDINEQAKLNLDLAALTFLPWNPIRVDDLRMQLLTTDDPEEHTLICTLLADHLKDHRDEVVRPLWQALDDETRRKDARLRAACALAKFDPEHPHWPDVAAGVAGTLVAENSLAAEPWVKALEPVKQHLLKPMATIFRNQDAAQATQRFMSASILVKYAADEPALLVDLAADADPRQFAILFPQIEKNAASAIDAMEKVLQETVEPDWNDAPLDPAPDPPAPNVCEAIEAADGLVDDHFAFCQTLPIEKLESLAEELGKSRYVPIRVRPYAAGQRVQVAAVWRRSAGGWRMAIGLSADEVRARDREMQAEGYLSVDVAGYLPRRHGGPATAEVVTEEGESSVRFAALWQKGERVGDAARLFVALDSDQPEEQSLDRREFGRATMQQYQSAAGKAQYAVTMRKMPFTVQASNSNIALHEYDAMMATDLLPVDLCIVRGEPPQRSTPEQNLLLAEEEVRRNPRDPDARLNRGKAQVALGDDEAAIDDLSFAADLIPPLPLALMLRAQAFARCGRAVEARRDVARFGELNKDSDGVYSDVLAQTEAVVTAFLGDANGGLDRLDDAAKEHPDDIGYLYSAACGNALVAEHLRETQPARSDLLRERAVALLAEAIRHGFNDYNAIWSDDDLAGLHELISFQALVIPRFAIVLQGSETHHWKESHGLSVEAHRARCRELMADGYRPAALSVANLAATESTVAASVWQRPLVAEEKKDDLAARKANAAVALLRLDQPRRVWPLLQHNSDPRLRSWLIHRFAALGADPARLIDRLHSSDEAERNRAPEGIGSNSASLLFDRETSIRRALVLALGEFDDTQFSIVQRQSLVSELLERYTIEPDAGLHAAIEWLLSKWGHGAELHAAFDALKTSARERRAEKAINDRRWRINSQGHTMVFVPGGENVLMGAPPGEAGRREFESRHLRRVAQPFYISACEVTVAQIRNWDPGFTFERRTAPNESCPANAVTWYQAAAYCNWLTAQERLPPEEFCYERNEQNEYGAGMRLVPGYALRRGYRLPTEAEWEFACRAGVATSRYYGASELLLGEYAWYNKNSQERWLLDVGRLKPNDLGLFDMLGNVMEWCADPFEQQRYVLRRLDLVRSDPAITDPIVDGGVQVLRGGGFLNTARVARCAVRSVESPDHGSDNVGFRVVRCEPANKEEKPQD